MAGFSAQAEIASFASNGELATVRSSSGFNKPLSNNNAVKAFCNCAQACALQSIVVVASWGQTVVASVA